MSISMYNGEKVVRCGRHSPTPYLLQHMDQFKDCEVILDLGCGEGRNSRYLRDQGIETLPFDRRPDYGVEWRAHEYLPVDDQGVDGVLINYLLMFLTDEELENVANQVNRVSRDGAILMVELEVVKTSWVKTPAELAACKGYFL